VLLVALGCATALNIIPFIRSNTTSANAYILYSNTHVITIDVGKEEDVVFEMVEALTNLTEAGRTFTGMFLTHGHPDHVMALWALMRAFPSTPAYVASQPILNELLNLMDIFGNFMNTSSPGNPDSHLPSSQKFNYATRVTVLSSPEQLWMDDAIQLGTDQVLGLAGETNHFAFIYFPTQNILFTGDVLYVGSHVFMGYDVTLEDQCDWLTAIRQLLLIFNNGTLIYPGHGLAASPIENVKDQIAYIEYARSQFVHYCNPADASNAILQQFPNFMNPVFLTALTAPFRVPYDAKLLGCACASPTDTCNLPAVSC